MLQDVSHKFRSGCTMLMREQQGHLGFLGSAFLVHRHGYLLTAAHIVAGLSDLVVVPTSSASSFAPMTLDRVAAMPVTVVRSDQEHDVALLRIDRDLAIAVPDDFLGRADSVPPGASVMALGYPFGHEQLHAILTTCAVVSAKIRSPNDTQLILFDNMVHDGDRGGPLVQVADGRIIGLVSGRFEPAEVVHGGPDWDRAPPRDTNISFAVAIDYGLDLMQQEGLPGPL